MAGPDDRLSGRTGTLMYMAPEVYLKQPYNDKADVYSFSIIAYEVRLTAPLGDPEDAGSSPRADGTPASWLIVLMVPPPWLKVYPPMADVILGWCHPPPCTFVLKPVQVVPP